MKILLLPIVFFYFYNNVLAQDNVLFADSLRASGHIPELSYAVVNSHTTLEIAALGHHAVNLRDTATLEDRFHLGSNTKAMTAFLIAKYVENGKLSWQTKFFDLFPDWKKGSRTEYHNISLQDLLSHRAHIQPFMGDHDPVTPAFTGNKQHKRMSFGKFVLTVDPAKSDTAHPFVYSNADYTLAAMMLERAIRKTWEQLVMETFNKDLHLDIKLSWPENQSRKDTWGHAFESGKLVAVPSNTDNKLEYTEPAGDINIQLKNYIRFIQLNLQGLNGHGNYLKASTYHFIHEGIPGYSLGWFNVYEDGNSLSVHSGTAGAYYTLVHIDRKKNLAYIIFTNSFNEETVNGTRLLMRRLKQRYSRPK